MSNIQEQTENVFNELVAFVREQVGQPEISITRHTLIEDDLGVTGDDADDLIIAFGNRYNVDVGNFNFAKYFNDEPGLLPIGRKIKPFTMGHLEKGILAGRLDEEIINS